MPLDALPAPANMRLGTKSGGGYGGKGGECSETSPVRLGITKRARGMWGKRGKSRVN